MTQAEAAPILLALLAQGPQSLDDIKRAIPARSPIFVASLLRTAILRGDAHLNAKTLRFSL